MVNECAHWDWKATKRKVGSRLRRRYAQVVSILCDRCGPRGSARIAPRCAVAILLVLGFIGQWDAGAATVSAAASDEAYAWTMFDFDAPSALSAWDLRSHTRARLAPSPWKGRGRALELTFEPQNDGRRHWPAAICRGSRIPLPPHPELYRYLLFRVKNVGETDAYFYIHFRNARGARWSSPNAPWTWRLQPGEERSVVCDLKDAFQAMPLRSIREMHIVTDTPKRTFKLVLDDIALSPGLGRRVESILDGLRKTRRILARTIPEGKFRRAMRARLFQLDQAAWDLRRDFTTASPPATTNVDAVLGKWLHALDAMEKQNQAALNRIRCEPGKARARRAIAELGVQDDWILGVESSMVKVAWNALPFNGKFGQPLRLDGARGEVVHGQVVIVPTGSDLHGVTWKADPLRGPRGARLPVRVRVVGFLRTAKPGGYAVPYAGWWPDPLLDHVHRLDVPAFAQQPLWITVDIPRDAAPGEYQGALHVTPKDRKAQSVPLHLRVRRFALPAEHHLKLAVNYEERVPARIYGKRWNEALKWRYRNFLLRHRFNVDSIYQILPMWDESVESLKRLKAGGQNFITAAVFNNTNAPGWKEHVRAFMKRARTAGVENICWFYGFDESPTALRKDILYHAKACHKLWPEVRVMTTATPELMRDPELRKVIDAWVPITPNYEKYAREIATVRAEGRQAWYYVCVGPKHPYANLFIEYPAIEARLLLGFMVRKTGADGFLYYSLNRAPKNDHPIADGPLCDWNPASYDDYNGDGCLFYCGVNGPVSTIRFENMRDGIEDYEAGWLLDAWLRQAGERHDWNKEARQVLARARRLAQVPDRVVRTLADYTLEPSELEGYRRELYDVLDALADLLERR